MSIVQNDVEFYVSSVRECKGASVGGGRYVEKSPLKVKGVGMIDRSTVRLGQEY